MKIPSKGELRYYGCCYPSGTRIQLDEDMDDPQPVLAGTKGTVTAVDAATVSKVFVRIVLTNV